MFYDSFAMFLGIHKFYTYVPDFWSCKKRVFKQNENCFKYVLIFFSINLRGSFDETRFNKY